MRIKSRYPSNWRDYQRKFQRSIRRKRLLRRFPSFALYSGCFFLILVLVICAGSWISGYRTQAGYSPSNTRKQSGCLTEDLSRQDLSILLRDLDLNSGHSKDHFVVENGGVRYTIKSSLDPALQDYILRLLKRSRALQAAVVVLNHNDGRILAMASYEKSGNGENLCLKASFPAASLFKIVSAAAALESAGFTPDRNVFFDGSKHTLYRRQLKNRIGRYTSKTNFRKAFASSINSVFGKLGIYNLGQDVMADYADRFLFNRTIPFDIPVEMSIIHVPDDDFGLAHLDFSNHSSRSFLNDICCRCRTIRTGKTRCSDLFIGPRTEESNGESSSKTTALPGYPNNPALLGLITRPTFFPKRPPWRMENRITALAERVYLFQTPAERPGRVPSKRAGRIGQRPRSVRVPAN